MPHIHLGSIATDHHDDEDECPDPADEHHHDDDAVYVPVLVMLNKQVQINVQDIAFSVPVPEPWIGSLPVLASTHFLTHSPPISPVPIYLEILTLLI